jgi:TP901-1 family phage major tail protein
MPAKKGELVLIKISNGGSPETFQTIGGIRTSAMRINSQIMESSNIESGIWQQLLQSSGLKELTIKGSGIFMDSASESLMRAHAFGTQANRYRFFYASGDYITASFHITEYERSGEHDDAEIYKMTLVSTGTVEYTAAG